MNRIVREHYPASELPERLRGDIDPSSTVTVTIEKDGYRADEASRLKEMVRKYRATIVGPGVSTEEAVARVRHLREEWDD